MDWVDSNRRNKDGVIVGGWRINRLLSADDFSTAYCVQVFNLHLIGFQLRAAMWEWKIALKKRGIMSLQKSKAVHPASEPDEISVIIGSRATFRFTAVRVMKYTPQHCCGKTVGSKVDLFHQCCSSICTKSWWIKLLPQILGGGIAPHRIRPWSERQYNAAGGEVQVNWGVFTNDSRRNREINTWIGKANTSLQKLCRSVIKALSFCCKSFVVLLWQQNDKAFAESGSFVGNEK